MTKRDGAPAPPVRGGLGVQSRVYVYESINDSMPETPDVTRRTGKPVWRGFRSYDG